MATTLSERFAINIITAAIPDSTMMNLRLAARRSAQYVTTGIATTLTTDCNASAQATSAIENPRAASHTGMNGNMTPIISNSAP
jgi:hypothetical protein